MPQFANRISIVHQFSRAIEDSAPSTVLEDQFDEIMKYVKLNAETENALMISRQYPSQGKHHDEHARLISELARAKINFGKGGEYLAMQKIKEWLVIHHQSDRNFADFLIRAQPSVRQ